MFYSKKMDTISKESKKIKDKILNLKNKNQKTFLSLEEKNNKLENNLKKITRNISDIETKLNSQDFHQDWSGYLKYKTLKEKLPNIKQMIELRKLKKLILILPEIEDKVEQFELLQIKALSIEVHDYRDKPYKQGQLDAAKYGLELYRQKEKDIKSDINEIVDSLTKSFKDEKLLQLFGIYAINTDWLLN
tara:strand:+ start:253 stop:822 length:570 start_codon:yes stop_codon:yes gene_type:complete